MVYKTGKKHGITNARCNGCLSRYCKTKDDKCATRVVCSICMQRVKGFTLQKHAECHGIIEDCEVNYCDVHNSSLLLNFICSECNPDLTVKTIKIHKGKLMGSPAYDEIVYMVQGGEVKVNKLTMKDNEQCESEQDEREKDENEETDESEKEDSIFLKHQTRNGWSMVDSDTGYTVPTAQHLEGEYIDGTKRRKRRNRGSVRKRKSRKRERCDHCLSINCNERNNCKTRVACSICMKLLCSSNLQFHGGRNCYNYTPPSNPQKCQLHETITLVIGTFCQICAPEITIKSVHANLGDLPHKPVYLDTLYDVRDGVVKYNKFSRTDTDRSEHGDDDDADDNDDIDGWFDIDIDDIEGCDASITEKRRN